MVITRTRRWLLPLLLGVIPVLAWSFAGRSQEAKPARERQADPPKGQPTPIYFGASTCSKAGCHAMPPADSKSPLVCKCDEYTTWRDKDKHRNAYAVLKEKRATHMGRLLRKEVTAKDTGCLACHGIVADERTKDTSFNLDEGVSCVVCHGAYKEWVTGHSSPFEADRKKWRDLSREDKQTEYGMTDLWNPAERTRMCVSCHIGNTAEGKVLTHEMYAAGHPPLPGIEVATFSDQMPRHWDYIKEKKKEVQEILHFTYGSERFEQTKLVAVSSIISLAETMRLLGTQASQAADAKDGEEAGLDFAHFDCYACHHDLKSPSWRQERGYAGKPGRPQMRPWPTALARVSLQEARTDGGTTNINGRLNDLAQAFSARPFGDPKQIASIANDLAESLTRVGKELAKGETQRYQAQAPNLLAMLCNVGDKAFVDYDSARQLAWAFKVIYEEWRPKGERDARVTEILDALTKDLKLELPAGPNKDIVKELPNALERINDYDPGKFAENMRKLAKCLPAK